jgi:hypothetical protein
MTPFRGGGRRGTEPLILVTSRGESGSAGDRGQRPNLASSTHPGIGRLSRISHNPISIMKSIRYGRSGTAPDLRKVPESRDSLDIFVRTGTGGTIQRATRRYSEHRRVRSALGESREGGSVTRRIGDRHRSGLLPACGLSELPFWCRTTEARCGSMCRQRVLGCKSRSHCRVSVRIAPDGRKGSFACCSRTAVSGR